MIGAAQIALLGDGRRLHLHHGPIDIVALAEGGDAEVQAAYTQAGKRFATILDELVADLPRLREPVGAARPLLNGAVAQRIFGTEDTSHPGVAHFLALRPVFVGGRVELIKRAETGAWYDELVPQDTRALFQQLGWKRIVGFQTRNVPHRAHEYLQRIALEYADGLFIQPLVGQRRDGDFTSEAVLKGYHALIGQFLPAERVVLGTLSTFMRFAGPREAVFHAIIRRNYGCTHFIVGRDHAGVGDWYGQYAAHDFAAQFEGDLGIEILRLNGTFFCEICDGMASDKTCVHHGSDATMVIKGTDMREILVGGGVPDPRLMRPEIVAALQGVPLIVGD